MTGITQKRFGNRWNMFHRLEYQLKHSDEDLHCLFIGEESDKIVEEFKEYLRSRSVNEKLADRVKFTSFSDANHPILRGNH